MFNYNDGIFLKIINLVTEFFSNTAFLNSQMLNFVNILLTIVGAYLTCWIMYRGYQILWGRSNDNIKDFMWDAFLKFIFIGICMYPSVWLNLITATLQELRDIKIGTYSFTEQIQYFWNKTFSVASVISENGETLNPFKALYNIFCIFGVVIGGFIGSFSMLMAYIINFVGFSFLLAITPFAFYCLIFGNFLKPIFKQWLMLILSSILTLLFLNIFISFAFSILNPMIDKMIDDITKTSFFQISVVFILFGLLIKMFVSLTTSIVEKMVGVGLENSISNSISSATRMSGGIAGLATYGAMKPLTKIDGGIGVGKAIGQIKSGANFIKHPIQGIKNRFKKD